MRTSLLRLLWIALFCASFGAHGAEKITIMVGGIDKLIYLPAKLAEQLGYLRETGLDVEFRSEPAGSTAETELLSGVAHGVIGFYDHTIGLQARGRLVQSVVQFSRVPGEAILVSRRVAGEIRSLRDLKGRTLGVTGMGSSTYHLTRYLAMQAGLKVTEFKVVPVGAGTSFANAMAKGEIDAGMTTEPTISTLVSSGAASVLVDLGSERATRQALGGLYPGACLYMPTTWINRHKDQVRKLAGAFVKALQYIEAHSAEEIADQMPKSFHGPDRALYIKAIEAAKPMFISDGVMPEEGPATVLKVLNASDKTLLGRSINLSRTYTIQFVIPGVR